MAWAHGAAEQGFEKCHYLSNAPHTLLRRKTDMAVSQLLHQLARGSEGVWEEVMYRRRALGG